MLVACGIFENSNSVGTSPDQVTDALHSAEAVPVTLKVLVASDWLKEKKWQAVFEKYEKSTGNKLEIQSAPINSYLDLVNTRLAMNDVQDLVFFWGQEGKIKQLQPQKNLVDLSNEEFTARIIPSVKKYFLGSGGKLYGIPVTGLNVSGVIYNKTVFRELGLEIPKTYEQFLDACKKIKAAGITPLYEAGKAGWPLQIYTFSTMAGVIIEQPDLMQRINMRQITFDHIAEFVDALQQQQDLFTMGYLNNDLFNATLNMSQEAIATGKAAMMVQADWEMDPILTKYPDAQIGMFPLPGEKGASVGISDPIGLYALKNSTNVEAAREFLNFFARKDVLTDYFNSVKSIPAWTGIDADLNPGTEDMNAYVVQEEVAPFFNALTVAEIGDYQELLQQMYGGILTPGLVAQRLQSNLDKAASTLGVGGF
ncbi:ABC transporter substrate-binding protein [Paenibacillus sp. FSL L8-0463]|uniref:ABC transporter substrate-binding protein n=1 Tax=Paenibacillus sp. FSL L8-0463 TaxID=2954687 RepID=UPI00311A3988